MHLKTCSLLPDSYPIWDAVCLDSKDAWFWHTTRWLEYTLAYNPSLKNQSCSFMVCEGSRALAVVPLMVEQHRYESSVGREFSFGGAWTPSPACIDGLSESQRKEVHAAIFARISDMAKVEGVKKISFRSNPFASLESGPEDIIPPAMRFGFTASLLPTQIINLQRNPADLLKEMRKGHRSGIHKAERHLKGIVASRENPSREVFESYRWLHEKASGRQTRPLSTFEMMYAWIKEGYGALFGATLDGRPVSFAYVMLYKENAYYGSSCNDPAIEGLPLAHFIQWEVLKWLHRNGFRYYELGWQFYSSTPNLPASEKEITISCFKRGFGGISIPIVLSERVISGGGSLSTNHNVSECGETSRKTNDAEPGNYEVILE